MPLVNFCYVTVLRFCAKAVILAEVQAAQKAVLMVLTGDDMCFIFPRCFSLFLIPAN